MCRSLSLICSHNTWLGIFISFIFFIPQANAQNWFPVGSPGITPGTATGYNNWIAIDKNGTPYIVYQDGADFFSTTVMEYNSSNWVTTNTGGLGGLAASTSIAIDTNGTPYVVCTTGIEIRINASKYSGGNWINITDTTPYYLRGANTSMAIDKSSNAPYIVYQDYDSSQKVTVMKYDSATIWTLIGNEGFSVGIAGYTTIAIDKHGTLYVAYVDDSTSAFENFGPVTVMKYNGSAWVNVGNPAFSAGKASYADIAIDTAGTPYVVYEDSVNGNKATVMKYNGSAWVNVGTAGFSAGAARYTNIAIDVTGTPYVVYEDGANDDKATVMKYNGSTWVNVGSAGFSAGPVNNTSIAIDPQTDSPYVVYSDSVNSWKATVMKFGFANNVLNVNNTVSLTAFPNPCHGVFTLNVSTAVTASAQVVITNAIGSVIKQFTTTTNNATPIQIDAPPSVYFITVVTAKDKQTLKLMLW